MITFNSKDLNQEAWAQRARAEAVLIHQKDSTGRGRSFEQVYETTKYGHAAEMYLIENFGFTDDKRPYRDIISPSGSPVEVKVTEKEEYVYHVLKRANEAAHEKWRKVKYPENLLIFISPRNDTIYTLYGYYKFNGKEFVKTNVQIHENVV